MDMNRRAYSFIEVKSVNEDRRIFRGMATTPTVDRVGDVVEPLGVSFKNPLPLLWQHDHSKPIGKVKFSAPTADGIAFEAEMPTHDEPGTLKDRLDEAWQSIKLGLVRAVSIGFRPIEYSFMDEGGVRFLKAEVFELSAVTVPANEQALIAGVGKSMDAAAIATLKRYDTGAPAEAEQQPAPEIQPANAPAATGKQARVVRLVDPARDRAKPFVIRAIKR